MNNSLVPIESNRFSKWQAHAYHRKVLSASPYPPRIPAFIDTLSSWLRNETQESYRSSIFFKTKCSFLFCFQNQIYCLWSLYVHLAWLVQNTLRLFQCRGVLLLLHIVGQGPAVLAAGAGRVSYIFYIFHLSSIANVLSFGGRLNMTEIL